MVTNVGVVPLYRSLQLVPQKVTVRLSVLEMLLSFAGDHGG